MGTTSTLGRANSRPLLQDLLRQVFVVEWAAKDYRTILAQLQSDDFFCPVVAPRAGDDSLLHFITLPVCHK